MSTQEEFLPLFTSAQPALQHFVAAHIPDLHDVEDVMQEVSVCLWKKFGEFTPGTSFVKWAIRVAQFEVLHARRTHARRRVLLVPELTERAVDRYESMSFENAEARRRALEQCMDELPAPQRDLLLARYRKGLSSSQIAQEWGRKENNVWIQLFRIRAALRKCMNGILGSAPA